MHGKPHRIGGRQCLARVILVNLDADQMCFRAEPIHPPNPTHPTASHARTAILVCLGDAALRPRALPDRMSLLRHDTGNERRVHGEEVRQRRQRFPISSKEDRRGTYRSGGYDPGQFLIAGRDASSLGSAALLPAVLT